MTSVIIETVGGRHERPANNQPEPVAGTLPIGGLFAGSAESDEAPASAIPIVSLSDTVAIVSTPIAAQIEKIPGLGSELPRSK